MENKIKELEERVKELENSTRRYKFICRVHDPTRGYGCFGSQTTKRHTTNTTG